MKQPTQKQIDVLIVINAYRHTYEISPTVAEVAKDLDSYPNAIQEKIDILVRDGFLIKEVRSARSIRLTRKGKSYVRRLQDGM